MMGLFVGSAMALSQAVSYKATSAIRLYHCTLAVHFTCYLCPKFCNCDLLTTDCCSAYEIERFAFEKKQ